ncbi:MAG: hypothetical protein NT050_05010 [Verrucomicrobia bacterium]|nr:hypothetical protein [Verrucomicrobiota bacterium]
MNTAYIEVVRLLLEAIPVGLINTTSTGAAHIQPGYQFVHMVA